MVSRGARDLVRRELALLVDKGMTVEEIIRRVDGVTLDQCRGLIAQPAASSGGVGHQDPEWVSTVVSHLAVAAGLLNRDGAPS